MAKGPKTKKQRLSVYLETEVMDALAAHAARRGLSLSMVAEAGIPSIVSPDAAERQEAAIAKRLDQLTRGIARLERDLTVAVEADAVFVRFWLTTTPSLPEPAAQAGERTEVATGNTGGCRCNT